MGYNNRTRLNDWSENDGQTDRRRKDGGKDGGRTQPCPLCGAKNCLTPLEHSKGFVCNDCIGEYD